MVMSWLSGQQLSTVFIYSHTNCYDTVVDWVNNHIQLPNKERDHSFQKTYWLAVIIYCPEKAEMAIKTKAWASCCTNLGTTSTHFVIISVFVLHGLSKEKEKKKGRIFQ